MQKGDQVNPGQPFMQIVDPTSMVVNAAGADWLEVSTDGRHLDALLRFFRLRQRRLGHV